MTTSRLPHEDITAAVAARRELGSEYDDAFVETIVERIEESLAARMTTRPRPEPAPEPPKKGGAGFTLALVSIGAVPLSAVAVQGQGDGRFAALFLVMAAIVVVNVAYALSSRRGPRNGSP